MRPAASSSRLSFEGTHLLALALAANVLLFIRIGVLFNPNYSYLAPAGADRVFYYAYTRSLVIDHDLDFRNELAMRPPTSGIYLLNGRPTNRYPIGSPMLALPAFAVTHAAVRAANALGLTRATADGYAPVYAFSYVLSEMAFALIGIWLYYRAVARYFPDHIAALGVIAAWFGTNVLHYTAVDLVMSHAAALFSVAWCSYEAVTLHEASDDLIRWVRLGAASAFVILVRYQDAVYLLVPLVAALPYLRNVAAAWRRSLAGLGGFLLMFAPQILAWHAIFGAWLVNSYESANRAEAALLSWSPRLMELMFDPAHGLVIWLPVVVAGIAGCFALAMARRDLIPAAAGVAWIVNTYVTGMYYVQNILRSGFDILFPVCLGLSFIAAFLWRRRPAVAIAVMAVPIAWSVPFAAITGAPLAGSHAWFLEGWARCLRLLAGGGGSVTIAPTGL